MAKHDDLEFVLGERLRSLRIAHSLSQVELAALANVSVSAIKNLESGAGASTRTLVRSLRAMGEEGWIEALRPPERAFSPLEALNEARRAEAAAAHGPPRVGRRGRGR